MVKILHKTIHRKPALDNKKFFRVTCFKKQANLG